MKQSRQVSMHHLRSSRSAILLFFVLIVFSLPQLGLAITPTTISKSSVSATDSGEVSTTHNLPDPTDREVPYEGSGEVFGQEAILQYDSREDEEQVVGLCDGVVWHRAARARSNGLGKELHDPRLGHL